MVTKRYLAKIIKENGQDLMEYAIIFPIFAIIMFGIFDLGRVVYYYSAMQNAAREGARYGVVNPYKTNQVIDRVKDRSIGVEQDELSVSVSWNCELVDVTVDFKFKPVTPLIGRLFPPDGDININTGSELQRERFNLNAEDSGCYDGT